MNNIFERTKGMTSTTLVILLDNLNEETVIRMLKDLVTVYSEGSKDFDLILNIYVIANYLIDKRMTNKYVILDLVYDTLNRNSQDTLELINSLKLLLS